MGEKRTNKRGLNWTHETETEKEMGTHTERERGREGGREEGREGGREGGSAHTISCLSCRHWRTRM